MRWWLYAVLLVSAFALSAGLTYFPERRALVMVLFGVAWMLAIGAVAVWRRQRR
jgi:hypothetical protein